MPCRPRRDALRALHTLHSACGAYNPTRRSGGNPHPRAGSTQSASPGTLLAQNALNFSLPSGPHFLVVGPRGVPSTAGAISFFDTYIIYYCVVFVYIL